MKPSDVVPRAFSSGSEPVDYYDDDVLYGSLYVNADDEGSGNGMRIEK